MTLTSLPQLQPYPSLARICAVVLDVWPAHGGYLKARFCESAHPVLPITEEIAGLVVRIAGNDLSTFADSYRWTCETLVAEDLHFRRTGGYRWTTFEDAYREVYSRADYMQTYLRGLLLSQVLWANQATAFHFYVERFLQRLQPGTDYLEIGPGHGLLLYFAARSPQIGSITGWDVSESSLAMTRQTMEAMGMGHPFKLELHNILEPPCVQMAYDAIVLSEVLEHLDRPEIALATVFKTLKPGGLAYFNVPVNSPAPDHIYYWGSHLEVENLVRKIGFKIVDSDAAPATGYSLERALRRKVTINSLIVAERPDQGHIGVVSENGK
ncbi:MULTISPECIES: class I SAM-dependent methyltransferase [unclassified Haematospirillum]|uniref:class I SAM-dependent methyltransferase n=1 Tax=unclassified Haematospirillum TaxID=2622088 RepID=UPI00143ADCBF|nr:MULTISPECIES: class I SAM-dependent methyltransferase [unclassified Haematospirillum]NKD56099.1 class I SAM-dependent methyltransferase [Haematospirillum sp. H4890]NKD76144.1 class I SAM-dependent methyltransferase [Haematospirillum sp. H4485]